MIAELFTSLFGLTVVLPPVLGLLLIVVGMAGHVVGLWDLNGGPDRGTGPVQAPARPVRPAQRRRELEDDAAEALRVRAQRLDRGDPDLEPTPVDLDALDRKDAA